MVMVVVEPMASPRTEPQERLQPAAFPAGRGARLDLELGLSLDPSSARGLQGKQRAEAELDAVLSSTPASPPH